jgi:sulfate permease, SulP family
MSERSPVDRLLPWFDYLIHYRRVWLRDDVLAGVTVAAYLVPQVMGYAQVAGLAPVAGLWTVAASLTIYAFVGSSRQLSVGPESTTALMTASIIGSRAGGDVARYAALAATLALLVGAIALIAWVMRLGFLADLLSKPVLVGYMAGVAIVMIVGQLGKITGVGVTGNSTVAELRSFIRRAGDTNGPTLALALGMLGAVFVVGRFSAKLPAPLIGVLLSTLAVVVFSLERHGVGVIGAIPEGLPHPRVPHVAARDLVTLILPALGIAVVGYSDNMLTARLFSSRHGQAIEANREWLAFGASNVGAGLLSGFPVSSSGSRTAIGDSLNSKTQVHSLVAVATVLATLLFAGPLLEHFPVAALGALVIYAASRLIDFAGFVRLASFRHAELTIAVIAAVGVVVVGALYGVLVAVALSIIELVRRVARPHDGILGYVPGLAGMHNVDDYPNATPVPGLLVYRYDAPLFFVNAQDFKRRAIAALDAAADVEWFVLNAEANVEVDITAIDALDELHREMDHRGIVFAMARVKHDLAVQLEATGFIARVGADRTFPTLPTAVDAYARWYEQRHGKPPAGLI